MTEPGVHYVCGNYTHQGENSKKHWRILMLYLCILAFPNQIYIFQTRNLYRSAQRIILVHVYKNVSELDQDNHKTKDILYTRPNFIPQSRSLLNQTQQNLPTKLTNQDNLLTWYCSIAQKTHCKCYKMYIGHL